MKNCKHNYTNKIMGWYKMSRPGEFFALPQCTMPYISSVVYWHILFIHIYIPSYLFFSPRFLGILFTFKYQVNNDLFEGFPDPSGGLRNLFFQILICFNLESLFCLKKPLLLHLLTLKSSRKF